MEACGLLLQQAAPDAMHADAIEIFGDRGEQGVDVGGVAQEGVESCATVLAAAPGEQKVGSSPVSDQI
jgi:hypothetical protein